MRKAAKITAEDDEKGKCFNTEYTENGFEGTEKGRGLRQKREGRRERLGGAGIARRLAGWWVIADYSNLKSSNKSLIAGPFTGI
jgi:hypothetical protein